MPRPWPRSGLVTLGVVGRDLDARRRKATQISADSATSKMLPDVGGCAETRLLKSVEKSPESPRTGEVRGSTPLWSTREFAGQEPLRGPALRVRSAESPHLGVAPLAATSGLLAPLRHQRIHQQVRYGFVPIRRGRLSACVFGPGPPSVGKAVRVEQLVSPRMVVVINVRDQTHGDSVSRTFDHLDDVARPDVTLFHYGQV